VWHILSIKTQCGAEKIRGEANFLDIDFLAPISVADAVFFQKLRKIDRFLDILGRCREVRKASL